MRYIIVAICVHIVIIANAQIFNLFSVDKQVDTTRFDKLNTNISIFYHTGIKPGVNAGVEFPLSRYIITSRKLPVLSKLGLYNKDKKKEIVRQNFIQCNITSYYHKNNHTGLLINGLLSRRRINAKRWEFDGGVGIGVFIAFLPTTYEYTDNGIDKVFMPTRSFITNNISISIAKEIGFLGIKPTIVFIKPSLYMIYPYNHLVNFGYSMEFGVRKRIIKNPFN